MLFGTKNGHVGVYLSVHKTRILAVTLLTMLGLGLVVVGLVEVMMTDI